MSRGNRSRSEGDRNQAGRKSIDLPQCNELAAVIRLLRQVKMLFSGLCPSRKEISDDVVEKDVVLHVDALQGYFWKIAFGIMA